MSSNNNKSNRELVRAAMLQEKRTRLEIRNITGLTDSQVYVALMQLMDSEDVVLRAGCWWLTTSEEKTKHCIVTFQQAQEVVCALINNFRSEHWFVGAGASLVPPFSVALTISEEIGTDTINMIYPLDESNRAVIDGVAVDVFLGEGTLFE